MATKLSPPEVSEQDRLLLLKLRTAAAVAIIKSKPEGTSAREFSEKLAQSLRNETWRKRAEDLQREVLTLRQELLLRRVGREEPESEVQEVFSEDLFGTNNDTERLESDSDTPDLLMDLSTNTYVLPTTCTSTANTTTANTTTAKATADTTATTTATPSASVFRETTVQEPLPHVQFLQALCGLQPFSGPRPDPLLLGSAPEGGPILEESVSQLLRSVTESADPGLSPGGLSPGRGALLWACEVCVSALDVHCSGCSPSPDFSRSLEELMGRLSHSLLLCRDQQPCDSLTDCALTLGRSPLLRRFLIGQILSRLRAVSEQLWTLCQASEAELSEFPLVAFGNSCRLMWILEQLLPRSNGPMRGETDTDGPMRGETDTDGPMRGETETDTDGPMRGETDTDGPMRASHSADGPMRGETDTDGPMRGETDTDGPMRGETDTDGPMRASHSADGPMRASHSADGPMRGETDTDGPMRGDTDTDGPMRASHSADGPMRGETDTDGPMRGETDTDGPMRASHSADGPMRGETDTDGPMRASHSADGPMRGETDTDGPMRASHSANGPLRASHSADGPVRASHSADGPLRASHSADGPVRASHSADGPVRASHCADGPVRASHCADGPVRVDLSSVRDELEELQRRVFPLSQEFPLFAVCLWRLLNLIANGNKTDDRE